MSETPDWPPRFTLTTTGAINLILLNFSQEQDENKTRMAMLMLVNQAYRQGYKDAADGSPARLGEGEG